MKRSRQCDRGQDKDALLNYHSDGFGSHTLAEQLEKQKKNQISENQTKVCKKHRVRKVQQDLFERGCGTPGQVRLGW